jgi:hypothetical protein
MTETDAGQLRHYEPVPRYKKRPGDVAFEGTNNTLVVLGRHRTGPVAEYDEDDQRGRVPRSPSGDLDVDGAGSIDLVAGRGQTARTLGEAVENSLGNRELGKSTQELVDTEGDPDFKNDRSRIGIQQKARVDVDMGLNSFNAQFSIEDSETGDGAIVVKSDKVRLIARSDIQLIVVGSERDADGLLRDSDNEALYATIVIKTNGDIVLRPSETGYLKLGGEEADKAIVCTDTPAQAVGGQVTAPPLVTTMGGAFAGTKIAGQGTYSSKVLIK